MTIQDIVTRLHGLNESDKDELRDYFDAIERKLGAILHDSDQIHDLSAIAKKYSAGDNVWFDEQGMNIVIPSAGEASSAKIKWWDEDGNLVGDVAVGIPDPNQPSVYIRNDFAGSAIQLSYDGSIVLAGAIQANSVYGSTFTPVLKGDGTAGTGTYTTNSGVYKQLGNIVWFDLTIVWTAHTGTGKMYIDGLPQTAASGQSVPCSVQWSNVTLAAAGNKIMALVAASSTQITLQEIGSGAFSLLPLDTAGTMRVSGFYFT